jgi:hypothetical protein
MATRYNGTSDVHNFGDIAEYSSSSKLLSIAALLRFTSTPSGIGTIVGKWGTLGDREYALRTGSGNLNVELTVEDISLNQQSNVACGTAIIDRWHIAVATIDGTNMRGFFANAEYGGSGGRENTDVETTIRDLGNNSMPLSMGANWDGISAWQNFAPVDIGWAAVWYNQWLTHNEVLRLLQGDHPLSLRRRAGFFANCKGATVQPAGDYFHGAQMQGPLGSSIGDIVTMRNNDVSAQMPVVPHPEFADTVGLRTWEIPSVRTFDPFISEAVRY